MIEAMEETAKVLAETVTMEMKSRGEDANLTDLLDAAFHLARFRCALARAGKTKEPASGDRGCIFGGPTT